MSIDSKLNKLTYEHYVCYPNDGNRHEIVDGDHYMNPAPSLNHQTVSRRLLHQLYTQIELKSLGWVFNAPVDVQLTEFDIVQPDLVVVLCDQQDIFTKPKIHGVPSLIIEILSPRTEQYDRTLKKTLYQRTGVPEYWIVDLTRKKIEQFVLNGGAYVLNSAAEQIVLTVLDGVSVTSAGLWDSV